MATLTTERWVVIATKASGVGAIDRWKYQPGFNAKNVSLAVGTGRLLTANKRVDAGWHLLAKLPQLKGKR